MLAPTITDKKIISLLPSLSTKQKKVILSVVQTFIEDEEVDIWQDKDFVKEMDRRFAELESGEDKGYTIEETFTKARKLFNNKKEISKNAVSA